MHVHVALQERMMMSGHEIEALRRARLAALSRSLLRNGWSRSDLAVGVVWALLVVVASIGGLIDTLHG
jgi:hypothetical protein